MPGITAALILVVGAIDIPASAQSARSADGSTLKFEVASIKRSTDRSKPDLTQPPAVPQSGQLPCGLIVMTVSLGRVRLRGQGVSMVDFIERLSNFLDRPIIDRTGYTDKFDVDLEFAPPDRLGFVHLGGVAMRESTAASPDENAALSVSTAVREHLRLKLESAKSAAEVLVIEHAERPSAN